LTGSASALATAEAIFHDFPYHQTVLHHATGLYEELPGWEEDLGECRTEEELPQATRDYLDYVADFVGVPVALIGVGPGREQVIWTAAGQDTVPARALAG
jgi:adenylosuccinate synthase